jgi:hypothetical protein
VHGIVCDARPDIFELEVPPGETLTVGVRTFTGSGSIAITARTLPIDSRFPRVHGTDFLPLRVPGGVVYGMDVASP